jgi:peptidoglycan/LPS O-acetylase OafA/YrhL
MHAPGIREGIFWFVSYLANFYYALEGRFSGAGSHLWSLAVEEQFYLCWPILVLFLPRRLLPWLLGTTILVGPSSRLVVALLTGGGEVPTRILTTSCLDALGAGAFLAWLWQAEQASIALRTRLGRLALATGACLLLAFYTLQTFHFGTVIRLVVGGTGSALVFSGVINRAAGRDTGSAGWLLECRPIVYLGTISYGMYVYQNFIIWALTPNRGLGQFLSVFVITATVAAASWHFFEKPLNNLKRFFPYLPRKLAGPEANADGLAPQVCTLSRQ